MGLPAHKTDAPGYVSPEDYLRLEREAARKSRILRRRNPRDGWR